MFYGEIALHPPMGWRAFSRPRENVSYHRANEEGYFINLSFIDDYSVSFKRANWMMHLLVSRSISSSIPFHSALKKTDKNLSF